MDSGPLGSEKVKQTAIVPPCQAADVTKIQEMGLANFIKLCETY
jgi:hypothetical protein